MKKKEDIFYYKKPFEIITQLNKARWGQLLKKGSPFNEIKAYLRLNGKRISFTFNFRNYTHPKSPDVGQTHSKVEFKNKSQHIVCDDFYLWQHSPPRFVATSDFYYSKGYSKKKKYYYKLLIPLSTKHDFDRELERIHLKSDGNYIKESTKAIINNDSIIINIVKDEKLGYFLCIESKVKQDYESFSEKSHAVKNGLGYITGYLSGNKGYYFMFSKVKMEEPEHFYVSSFRNEINSRYTPIHSNPYGYIRHRGKSSAKYYKDNSLRVMKITEFSILCQRLHDSLEFSTVVLLILESTVATLLSMPGSFAIALETMSDIVINKTKLNLAPITDKNLSKLVRDGCKDIIDKHCSSLEPGHLSVLHTRIANLNQITNKQRLKAPFELLKVKLLPEDLVILETRNDFLHGRIPDLTKAGKTRTLDRKNKDLYYSAMRFYTILNILILKWIGFDGRIVNYPKINEGYTKLKLKEDHFRKV